MQHIVGELQQDLRISVRRKGVCSTIIAVLAIGIGATSLIFTVVDAALIRPMPYPNAASLTTLWEKPAKLERSLVSVPNFRDWAARSHSFVALAALDGNEFSITGVPRPESAIGAAVSPGLFQMLGVRAAYGRTFLLNEDDAAKSNVVVLNHSIAVRLFGSAEKAVGQTLTLDGLPFTVIGVMPTEFRFYTEELQLWKPLVLSGTSESDRGYRDLRVFGALRFGTSIEQAQNEMTVISSQLETAYPAANKGYGVSVISLQQHLVGVEMRDRLLLLLSSSLVIFLIACFNLANLLLATGLERQKEMAVRLFLGATRWALIRQSLTETLVLSAIGGSLGLFVAHLALPGLEQLLPPKTLPPGVSLHIDPNVVLFASVLSCLIGLVLGLIPPFVARTRSLDYTLRESSRSSTSLRGNRLGNAFIVVQLAVCLMLCTACGLLMRSLGNRATINPGFRSAQTVTMRLASSGKRFHDPAEVCAFLSAVLAGLENWPGVRTAALVTSPPLAAGNYHVAFQIQGAEEHKEATKAILQIISERYFDAMGVRLTAGRPFSPHDGADSQPVAIVNAAFVKEYLGKQNPLTSTVAVPRLQIAARRFGPPVARLIVGVAGNTVVSKIDDPFEPTIYVPYRQSPWPMTHLVVQPLPGVPRLDRSIRQAVWLVDPEMPIVDVKTMADAVAETMTRPKIFVTLIGSCALLALVLSLVGVFGLVSYRVRQRTREIGIRISMGATPGRIATLLVSQSVRLALTGVIFGLIGIVGMRHWMASLLYGVDGADILTLAVSGALLVLCSIVASLIPAIRVVSIDPVGALRQE